MIKNVKAGQYEHITLFGQPALFTDERIARDCVPGGWFCYDIRGCDDDPWQPATVEPRVSINHAGTVLCPAPLELGGDEYRELGDAPEDGIDFLGEEICYKDFCRVHGLPEVAAEQKLMLHPTIDRNARFYYSADADLDLRRGCIGHVRIDFGKSGQKFWHTWFPRGPQEWNTAAFSQELTEVITALRQDVLKSLPNMRRFCNDHGGKISGGYSQNYGYEMETERYRYCLRCNPIAGDYNAYLTCYDKAQEQIIGRLKFADGEAASYHDKQEFLTALKKELPYRPTTGMMVEVLTDDPEVWELVDDSFCDYGIEETPLEAGKAYTIRCGFGKPVTLLPRVELYSVKDFMGEEMPGLAIVLDEVGETPEDMEQYAVLTVSFGEFIGMKNAAYVDANNCRFANLLREAGIARDTGLTKSSGLCDYPLWVFDEDFLREHSSDAYEEYEQEYDAYMASAFGWEDEDEEQGMHL